MTSPRLGSGDKYLLFLAFVLTGYALMGKGFAYFGVAPLYIGEIALLCGLFVLLQTGYLIAPLATMPSLLLMTLMIWVVLRTVPFVNDYGIDAVRDSVVVLYGCFTFILVALTLQDDRRLGAMVRYYRTFAGFFVPAIFFIYGVTRSYPDYVPLVPGTSIRLVWVDAGQVAVHLTGAALFALVGLRSPGLIWTALLLATLAMVSVTSRGGMLAFVIPVMFAMLILGKLRQIAIALAAGLALFVVAYTVETTFGDYQEARGSNERSLSTHQIVENVSSIFGSSNQQTEGTKVWRLEWWNLILRDTFFGPHFWGGRGFGLNLGDADGYRDGTNIHLPPLRSPHSVHMTLLARAGVPGAALWAAFQASWLWMVLHTMWVARRLGHQMWAGLFLFLGCYGASFIINASFDVALEGPMQGIWFWTVIGWGIGAVMVYRERQKTRSGYTPTMLERMPIGSTR